MPYSSSPPTDANGMDVGRDELPSGPVRAFTTRLRSIPLSAWLEVALSDPHGERRTAPADDTAADGDTRADAEARHRLRAVLDHMPGTATHVRRRIHDLASVAGSFATSAAVARMTRVALVAALALAARPHLREDDFARLYRPFARLIPLEEVTAAAERTAPGAGGEGAGAAHDAPR